MKKILLAEDHDIVIKALKLIFENDFAEYRVDIVKRTDDLMNSLRENRYELLILDLELEDNHSLHLIGDIVNSNPDMHILIFSALAEHLSAEHLEGKRIKGYLNKQSNDEEIIYALKTVLAGRRYVHRSRA